MPKYHKRHASRRSTSRRKTRRRSRRIVSNLSYVHQRCVSIFDVVPQALSDKTDVIIPWQQPQDAASHHTVLGTGFDATPRWQAVSPNYEEYSVTGLKMHWIPAQNVKTFAAAGVQISRAFKVDALNDVRLMYNMSENAIISAPGFQLLNPYSQYRKWQSCRKISHQQNVKWQSTTLLSHNNTLTTAGTMLRFTYPYSSTVLPTIGTIKLTWYITMRGQRQN